MYYMLCFLGCSRCEVKLAVVSIDVEKSLHHKFGADVTTLQRHPLFPMLGSGSKETLCGTFVLTRAWFFLMFGAYVEKAKTATRTQLPNWHSETSSLTAI
eukprot:4596918-Amphidinium_carterae.1